MLDARQIRDLEFIKNGVKRKAKAEAQQFLERTAVTVETLQNENASVRAENIELTESNTRLKEMNDKLENEKEMLLQKLSSVEAFSGQDPESIEMLLTRESDITSIRNANNELTESNSRMKTTIEQLEDEKVQLLQKLASAESGSARENDIAPLLAANAELLESNTRMRDKIERLEDEKAELLQKLADTGSNISGEDESASLRTANAELAESNARMKESVEQLESEKALLVQKVANYESTFAEGNENTAQISTELTESNAQMKQAIQQLEDEKAQLLQKLSDAQTDSNQENEMTSLRAANNELDESNSQLIEKLIQLEEEKAQLQQKLTVLQNQPTVNSAEAENMLKAAQDKAKLIIERADRDYLLKMTRANAAIIQKTIAFEQEFGDNLRKLKIADGEVRRLKMQLSKLLEQIPNGLGENTEVLLDRLKNHE